MSNEEINCRCLSFHFLLQNYIPNLKHQCRKVRLDFLGLVRGICDIINTAEKPAQFKPFTPKWQYLEFGFRTRLTLCDAKYYAHKVLITLLNGFLWI